GPDLLLGELLGGDDAWRETRLGYATPAGAPALRSVIADLHGVDEGDVVVTIGGMHALFLLGYILSGACQEAVITPPPFPPRAAVPARARRARECRRQAPHLAARLR